MVYRVSVVESISASAETTHFGEERQMTKSDWIVVLEMLGVWAATVVSVVGTAYFGYQGWRWITKHAVKRGCGGNPNEKEDR